MSSTKFCVHVICAPMSCKHGTGPCAFGAVIYYHLSYALIFISKALDWHADVMCGYGS